MAPSRGETLWKKRNDARERTKKNFPANHNTVEKEASEQRGKNGSKTGKQEGLFEHGEVYKRNGWKTSVETNFEKCSRLLDEAFEERLSEMDKKHRERVKEDMEEMKRKIKESFRKYCEETSLVEKESREEWTRLWEYLQ